MSSKVLIFHVFLVEFLFVSGVEYLQTREKRATIDLQTCILNFNIHKDKIIRTQDSQKMGAKYLNEIDLGSREECLRLCCETDNCDVFVFEEKNSGSCYLFHCGPPEDFKCKFTHQLNYTSGVLAVNRVIPDLESQIKLTKHEQDLTKLRKPDLESQIVHQLEVKTTPTTTTAASKEIVPPFKPKTSDTVVVQEKKCSNVEYQCKSTGECIAIYNVCDGVPQCPDGSDEGIELKCPGYVTTQPPPPPIISQPQSQQIRYDPDPIKPLPQLNPPYQQRIPQVQEDFRRPSDPGVMNRISYIPQYIPQVPNQQQQWVPRGSNQLQEAVQYSDNSRIFTHKESGLQVPDGQEISQLPYPDPAAINRYQYYQGNYRPPIQQETWPMDPYRFPQPPANQENMKIPENYKPTLSNSISKVEKVVPNPKHIQEKMAYDLKHSKDTMPHAEEAKIKIEKHVHKHESYPDVIAYKLDPSAADGYSQMPRSAILTLTLGLIITAITAILIGCRLKVVKRRMKRGGKSYAHEADYLVNGMYL